MTARSSLTANQRYSAYISWVGLLLCLLFLQPARAFVEVPELEKPVTDLTGTLSTAEVQSLETKLFAFAKQKGSQISVLLVPTTQPEDIAEFGIKVGDLWRNKRKDVDDAAIIIVAKDDRKFRIEVGYGLEGVIPDAVAKRITSETMKPYFKNNDIYGGINAGIDQMIKLIEGEPLPAPKPDPGEFSGGGEGSFLFVLFAGLFAGSILSSIFGRVLGAMFAGAGSTLVASALMGFGIGAIFVGILVFFLLSAHMGGGGGWSNRGGYGGGYYGGGGSWGGGSSSGSWTGSSDGGSSFGGGGASDSW